jgi:hypothetical protein
MPSQMTVKRPNTRVILIELQNHKGRNNTSGGILSILQHMHIATNSVGGVDNSAVPGAEAFSEDVEVMTVEMHRVTANEAVVYEVDADGFIGAKVKYVPIVIVSLAVYNRYKGSYHSGL